MFQEVSVAAHWTDTFVGSGRGTVGTMRVKIPEWTDAVISDTWALSGRRNERVNVDVRSAQSCLGPPDALALSAQSQDAHSHGSQAQSPGALLGVGSSVSTSSADPVSLVTFTNSSSSCSELFSAVCGDAGVASARVVAVVRVAEITRTLLGDTSMEKSSLENPGASTTYSHDPSGRSTTSVAPNLDGLVEWALTSGVHDV